MKNKAIIEIGKSISTHEMLEYITDCNFIMENNYTFYLEIKRKNEEGYSIPKNELIENLLVDILFVPTKHKYTNPNGKECSFFVDTPEKQGLKTLQTSKLGYSLVNILNSYDKIISSCKNTKSKLNNFNENDTVYKKIIFDNNSQIDCNSNYAFMLILEILKEQIIDFHNILPEYCVFLSLDIYNFIAKMQKEFLDYIYKSSSFSEESINAYAYSTKYKCITCIENFCKSLEKVKNIVDNSYIKGISDYTGENKRGHELSFTELNISPSKILLAKKRENQSHTILEPSKFVYTVNTFEDLCFISLYQLNDIRKALVECKNCGKYFISPNMRDIAYCDNLFTDKKTCKQYKKDNPYPDNDFIIGQTQYIRNEIRKLLNSKKWKIKYGDKFLNDFKTNCEKLDTKKHKNKLDDHLKIFKYCKEFMEKFEKENKDYTGTEIKSAILEVENDINKN